MLPDEVRKAVETIECWAFRSDEAVTDADEWQTIRAHLLAREAEVEMLRAPFSDEDATAGSHWFGEWVTWKRRCERAEALLRECSDFGVWPSIRDRITAHLSENSRG